MQYIVGAIFILIFLTVCFCTSSWFSIARIHTAIWLALYLGYCICSGGDDLKCYGVLWLILSCFFILIGEKMGEQGVKQSNSLQQPITASKKRDRLWLFGIIFLTGVSLVGNVAEVYAYGFSLNDLLSLSRLLNMSNQIAVMRYSGFEISSVVTLLQNHKYVACLIGGYYFLSCKKIIKKLVCCLPFIPVILNVLIENTKAGVIASAILFCIGLMIGYETIHLRYPRLSIRRALRFLIAGGVLLGLLIFAMVIRIGKINSETLSIVADKFIVYAFGNVKAFDMWLSDLYQFDGLSFGLNTFMAPFNLLGLVTRKQGVYDFVDGVESNVFSGYRGVIEDFGLFGGLLFVLLMGYIGGRCMKKIIKSPSGIMPKLGYAFVLFFVVYSFIISPYIYSSFWIVMVEFAFLLYIEKYTCLNR